MELLFNKHCPIYFGKDSLLSLEAFLEKNQKVCAQIFILCDTNTRLHCWPILKDASTYLKNAFLIEIPCGEQNKNLDTVSLIWSQLLAFGADRNSLLINLGGGVVCDMGGFAASCYKRGIDFIHIPTSLLAMVDASVGGKTAVDFGGLKNTIGLFSMPKAVFIDPIWLDSCSEKELRAAYAEIIKMFCLFDPDFIISSFTYHQEALCFAVQQKIKVVEEDFQEKGIRRYLNFGHSFGHALESLALSKGESLIHGEAVALGMLCALFLSVSYAGFPKKKFLEAQSFFKEFFPYFPVKEADYLHFLAFLKQDKKNENKLFSWVLLSNMGKAVFYPRVDEKSIREVWNYYVSLESIWKDEGKR